MLCWLWVLVGKNSKIQLIGETGVTRDSFLFSRISNHPFFHFYVFHTLRYPPYFLFNFVVNRLPVGDGQSFQKFVVGAYDEG